MAVFDEEWQKVRSAITERGIFMFNNELLSDVSLVVRSSTGEDASKKSKMAIPAHKMVLSICSPVFFAMFCGHMAEKSDSVDLPDCEYEGVLEMLRYMYSEEVKLSDSNVMQVLYAAKKYMLSSLADECIEFLQENLNTGNVFCVLSNAQQYEEKDLTDQCWEMVDRETEEAVKSDAFVTIERSLLEAVVQRDSLTISEVGLFQAVDRWASKQRERQGLTENGNVKRKILGEKVVKEIRFPVMDETQFANVVLGLKILTSEEVVDIMKCFNSVQHPPAVFPEKQRTGTIMLCKKFNVFSGIWHSNNKELKNNCERKEYVDLQVDRDIDLHGIRMFGRKNCDCVIILKITDTRNNSIVASKSGVFSPVRLWFESSRYYGFDVLFDSPVCLSAGNRYSVNAIIDGPKTTVRTNGIRNTPCHGVKFTFLNCNQQDQRSHFAAFLFRLSPL